MRKIILALFILPLVSFCQTNTLRIKGKVLSKDSIALIGVSVQLYEGVTNKQIATTTTDGNGSFAIESPSKAVYLTFNHLGYISYRSNAIFDQDLIVRLSEQPQMLKQVSIIAQKPFIEQQFDRTVVNVGGNIRAGINAIDILKKIPGLVILNGTDLMFENRSVSIMMDGKLIRMTGNELITMLNGTSPATISEIEAIHSPSAKNDAQSGGAIINIKTLKRQMPGYDMNLGITTGHGWKYPAYQSIITGLTYRNKNNYLYGSYSYGFGKQSQQIAKNSFITAIDQRLSEVQTFTTPYRGQNLRVGWDHYFKSKNAFSVLLTAYKNNRNANIETETAISSLNSNNIDSMRYASSGNNTNGKGVNLNFNYKIIIDSAKRQELTMDADLGVFDFANDNQLNTRLEDTRGIPLFAIQGFLQHGKTNSKIYSYKLDYNQKLFRGTLEAGFKASYVNLGNEFVSLYNYNAGPLNDLGSNDFLYQETLLAGYLSSRQTFKKVTLQFGLRAEETITNGNSLTLNNIVERSYLNLFPNALINYKFTRSSLSFSYGKRIGRPSYNYLNPFVILRGAYDVGRGNPYLNPSFTDAYRLGYNLNFGLSVAISHSIVKDVITDLQEVNNQTKITTNYKANLNRNNNTGLSLSFSKQFFKLWNLNLSSGSSLNSYHFDYQKSKIEVKQVTAYLSINNNFRLPKEWWFDLSFYGQSRATYGYQINLPYYNISSVVGKGIWNNKASLSLGVNDIFFSSITRSEANYANVNYKLRSQYDSRNFKLNFNYRFGNAKIDIKKRSAGSVEEQGRNQ